MRDLPGQRLRERRPQLREIHWRVRDHASGHRDHRNDVVVLRAQFGVLIDVELDKTEREWSGEMAEFGGGRVAQAAELTRVERDLPHGHARRGAAAVVVPNGAAGEGAVPGARSSENPSPTIPTPNVTIDTICGKISQSLTT